MSEIDATTAGSSEPNDQRVELFTANAPLTHVEVRDPSQNPDNTWTMSGYAAVFGQQATLAKFGGQEIKVEFAADAFNRVLASQDLMSRQGVVHFNLGHDMHRAVAASDVPAGQPGSLKLTVDGHGLKYLAKVSRDDPDGLSMAVKMRDGVIKQASVAFATSPGDNEYTELDEATVLRRINSVDLLMDVCATPQGVFANASSQLEQYAARFGHPEISSKDLTRDLLGAVLGQPSVGAEIPISTEEVGRVAKPRLTADELRRIRRYVRH